MSVERNYATALYQAISEQSDRDAQIEAARKGLASLCELLSQSREMNLALTAPIASVREKVSIAKEVAKKLGLNSQMTAFFVLLAEKDRVRALQGIRTSFEQVRVAAKGGLLGSVKSAESMEPSELSALAAGFTKKLGKMVEFTHTVDSGLLAGLSVTVDGVTYDGTLRGQLNKLKNNFLDTPSGNA